MTNKAELTKSIEAIDEAVVTEDQVMLANHDLEFGDNLYHFEVTSNQSMRMMNEIVKEVTEQLEG